MTPLLDIPTETALLLELFEMEYEPLPPEMLTIWLLLGAKEILFWPNVRPDVDVFEALTVTVSVAQLFDASQTLIVAVPAVTPETVSALLDKLVETTLVLELLDIE